MSDVKSVIALLCKHLHLSINCAFKPEYFRLAKYNKADDDVTQALWTVLHILSRETAKNIETDIDFDRYANQHATKLYLAFLQYPSIEFYALSRNDNSSNAELLLAFGWLLATKDALNIAIRAKLPTSILSKECSDIDDDSSEKAENNVLQENRDARLKMRAIVHTCGRISHNVKEIAELMNEKIKLTTKIHGASLNASGLPHLSVSQVSLTKKCSIVGARKDEKYLKELHSIAILLDTHAQWTKQQSVFYDWMLTVISENKNDERSKKDESRSIRSSGELSKFLSLLRHVTKKQIHELKTNNETSQSSDAASALLNNEISCCCSRFLRSTQPILRTETELWSLKTSERLNLVENDVEIKMNELASLLKQMLRSIPNCVEI